jgi:phage-related protein
MENLIETLRKIKTGYGHFKISIEMNGQELKTTTTNTMSIDAAFDDCYDDEDNCERYYSSRKEAQESLVGEILTANEIVP